MGCINANISSQCGCLRATITRVGEGLSATISTAEEPIRATISRVGAGLSIRIGLVCTPNTDVYLRVNPNTLWFFKENEILDVDVISNINWIVK